MRLYEYEGKSLFEAVGMPLPKRVVISTPAEVSQAIETVGLPVVVKAQVLHGGRGKAGLVKVASTAEEAERLSAEILSKIQPGEKLMLEAAFKADAEAYMGITVNDIIGRPVMVVSASGGIHVEEAAASGSGKMISFVIDPVKGLARYELLAAVKEAGFSGKIAVKLTDVGMKLYKVFVQFDCDTAEINPVMINTAEEKLIAGDAKVITDEYAYFRQPEISAMHDARKLGDSKICFVDLGGDIAIVSGGASGTMMLCDSIKVMGGEPGNFLDGTGGNSPESVCAKSLVVLEKAVGNPRFSCLLFNFNLTASSLASIVQGVCMAVDRNKPDLPIVASIRASGAALSQMSLEEAKAVLATKGINLAPTLQDAIRKVVEISKERNGGNRK